MPTLATSSKHPLQRAVHLASSNPLSHLLARVARLFGMISLNYLLLRVTHLHSPNFSSQLPETVADLVCVTSTQTRQG